MAGEDAGGGEVERVIFGEAEHAAQFIIFADDAVVFFVQDLLAFDLQVQGGIFRGHFGRGAGGGGEGGDVFLNGGAGAHEG